MQTANNIDGVNYRSKATFSSPLSLRRVCLILIAVSCIVLWGCGTKIGTKQVGFESAYNTINKNALQGKGFSTTSRKVLLRYNLESSYKETPKETLDLLLDKTRDDNRRDLLFAMAELSYHTAGGPVEDSTAGFEIESRQYYLNAAVFAYFYLFEPQRDVPVDPYDRNFRWACDIYNIALARALTDASGHLDFKPAARQLPRGELFLSLDPGQYPWNPVSGEGMVLAADELAVFGLTHRNRESGIGVPFMVVQEKAASHPIKRSYPGTLLLKIEGGLKALHQGRLAGQMSLYTPLDASRVSIAETTVPLEKDMSVQLAQTLNQKFLWKVGIKEFFTGENRFKTGLYEVFPYSPGKIPVVFVHGTFSNPIAWAGMCNSLLADPIIRNRFHFWFYLYDSNRPVNLSALYLRGALKEKIKAIDPDGQDPYLNEMVVIGHSQGGLLTRLTVTDTEDKVIRAVTGKGIDELGLSEEQRLTVEKTAVFEPLPFVRRVVFMSTPHRGSKLVSGWIQNLVRKVVTVSAETLKMTSEVMAAIPEENIPEEWRYERNFTSIDDMSPDSPVLIAFSKIPMAPGVKSHSIIGVLDEGDPTQGSDGVVTYQSAHLDGVASEFIIQPAGHSTQRHPLAVEEVRRILLLHLDENDIGTK